MDRSSITKDLVGPLYGLKWTAPVPRIEIDLNGPGINGGGEHHHVRALVHFVDHLTKKGTQH